MDWRTNRTAAIIGGGTMGHGIAQCFAVAGWRARVHDALPACLASLKDRVAANLAVFEEMGLVDAAGARAALDNIIPCHTLAEAVSDAALVVETVSENLALKGRIFGEIERAAPGDALLATNTSAIAIGEIAPALARPARLVGTHFWNPPHVIPCVEVIRHDGTDPAVFEAVADIMAAIGKEPVRVLQDLPGFLGNRLQHALQREALHLVDSGAASAEDVDKVVRHGFGLRLALMGPLKRADLGGLDVTLAVQSYLLPHLHDGVEASAGLREMVARGRLGAKVGRGYYDWPPEKLRRELHHRDRLLLAILKLRREAGEE